MTAPVMSIAQATTAANNKAGFARRLLDPVSRLGGWLRNSVSRLGTLPGAATVAAGWSKASGLLARSAKAVWRGIKTPLFLIGAADSLTTEDGRKSLKTLSRPFTWVARKAGSLLHTIVRAPFSWFGQARIIDTPVAKIKGWVTRGLDWVKGKVGSHADTNGKTMLGARVVTGLALVGAWMKTAVTATGTWGKVLKVTRVLGVVGAGISVLTAIAKLTGLDKKITETYRRVTGKNNQAVVTEEIAAIDAEAAVQADKISTLTETVLDAMPTEAAAQVSNDLMALHEQAHAETDPAKQEVLVLAAEEMILDAAKKHAPQVARQMKSATAALKDLSAKGLKKQTILKEIDTLGEMGDLVYAIHVREKDPKVVILNEVMSGNKARTILREWGQETGRQKSLEIVENEVYLAQKAKYDALYATSK